MNDHAAFSEWGGVAWFHVDLDSTQVVLLQVIFGTSPSKSCWLWSGKGNSWDLSASPHPLGAWSDKGGDLGFFQFGTSCKSLHLLRNWNSDPLTLVCKRATASFIENAVLFYGFLCNLGCVQDYLFLNLNQIILWPHLEEQWLRSLLLRVWSTDKQV